MFFGGDLAYWVGPSAVVAGLGDGETFGVSLVDVGGSTVGHGPRADLRVLNRIVRRRCVEVGAMELEQSLGSARTDVVALVAQHR